MGERPALGTAALGGRSPGRARRTDNHNSPVSTCAFSRINPCPVCLFRPMREGNTSRAPPKYRNKERERCGQERFLLQKTQK